MARWACGRCEYRLSGWETLWESQRNSGSRVDGTWAEYTGASADLVGRVDVNEAMGEVAHGVVDARIVDLG